MANTNTESARQLESLLDTMGVKTLVELLSDICFEKAEHLRSNWQDNGSAKVWDKNAKVLQSAELKLQDNW
jgi:hypothetical protein